MGGASVLERERSPTYTKKNYEVSDLYKKILPIANCVNMVVVEPRMLTRISAKL